MPYSNGLDLTNFCDFKASVNFLRRAANNSSQIHCRYDVIDIISAEALERTAKFIVAFSNRVIESKFFPIDKTMPEIMVDKINKYLRKKL